jgi:hypothetical protein
MLGSRTKTMQRSHISKSANKHVQRQHVANSSIRDRDRQGRYDTVNKGGRYKRPQMEDPEESDPPTPTPPSRPNSPPPAKRRRRVEPGLSAVIDHTIEKANVIRRNRPLGDGTTPHRAGRKIQQICSPSGSLRRELPLPTQTSYGMAVSSPGSSGSTRRVEPNINVLAKTSRQRPSDTLVQKNASLDHQVKLMDFSNLGGSSTYAEDLPKPIETFVRLLHTLKGKCPRCWLIGTRYEHTLDDCSGCQGNLHDDNYKSWRGSLRLQPKTCFICLGSQVRGQIFDIAWLFLISIPEKGASYFCC